jgi:hypothetical protein
MNGCLLSESIGNFGNIKQMVIFLPSLRQNGVKYYVQFGNSVRLKTKHTGDSKDELYNNPKDFKISHFEFLCSIQTLDAPSS